MKRVFPVAEVAVVLALFATLRVLLRETPFATWQKDSFAGFRPAQPWIALLQERVAA